MDIDDAAARARRARAVEELRRRSKLADQAEGRLSTVTESDGTPAPEEQECNHFSIRGHVAMLQKKDPKYDEHHDSSLVLVPKFLRWDCSKCLDRLKVSKEKQNFSKEQGGTNYGRSVPHNTHPSIHPSIQKVDPPYPPGPPASPTAEETISEVASNF